MRNIIDQAKKTSEEAFETGKEIWKQGIEWKKGLSGAFSNEQLFFSFVVLGVFYIGYLLESAVTDKNEKDEDDCSCKSSHHIFYISWFTFCTILWFTFHTCLLITGIWPGCAYWLCCLKYCCLYNLRKLGR